MSNYVVWILFHSATGSKVSEQLFVVNLWRLNPLTVFLSDATVYVGGLDEKVSEPLLWELFLQAGPVVNTHMPKDRVTGQHQGEHLKNSFLRKWDFPCNDASATEGK